MLKKCIGLISLLFVFAIGFTVSTQTVKAYNTIGWYWVSPNSLSFYVDSQTITEGYETHAAFGGTAWNPSSKVQMNRSYSSTNDGYKTRFTSTNDTDIGNYYAKAATYKSDGSACSPGYYCKAYKGIVTINDEDFEDIGTDLRKETMIHEIGHILGLAHEDYIRPAVMISGSELTGGWCYCLNPQTDDYNGINALYPY
jgi:hypothetical protein